MGEAKPKADEAVAVEAKRKADEVAAVDTKRKANEAVATGGKRKTDEEAATEEMELDRSTKQLQLAQDKVRISSGAICGSGCWTGLSDLFRKKNVELRMAGLY